MGQTKRDKEKNTPNLPYDIKDNLVITKKHFCLSKVSVQNINAVNFEK